jgi:hypothetical protein
MYNIIHLHIHASEGIMADTAKRRQQRVGEKESAEPVEALRKKNFRLRQSEIDRAMQILGTRTETETIEQALQMIAFQQEMLDAVDAMYGAGIVNVFDEGAGAEIRD